VNSDNRTRTARKSEIIEALSQSTGERHIHNYLKRNPALLWGAFMSCGGHSDYVIPEFAIGTRFRSDFVIMQSYSGGWNVEFVELEPVSIPLFNQDGTPSKRLRGALKQVDDWKRFTESDNSTLRSQLAHAAKTRDLFCPKFNLGEEPNSFSNHKLRDPHTYIQFGFNIVIGRRSELSETGDYIRNSYPSLHNVQICTYDRFVQVAENADKIAWQSQGDKDDLRNK